MDISNPADVPTINNGKMCSHCSRSRRSTSHAEAKVKPLPKAGLKRESLPPFGPLKSEVPAARPVPKAAVKPIKVGNDLQRKQ